MHPFILAIIIVLIIIVVWRFILAPKERLKSYMVNPDISSPKVVITGTMHGDEPAGSVALKEMLRDGEFNKYNANFIIIPTVNEGGLALNTRETPEGVDLNREFRKSDLMVHPLVKQLRDISKDADLTIDLHEGWGWKTDNNGSVGSSIYGSNPEHFSVTKEVANSVGFSTLAPDDLVEKTFCEWRRQNGKEHYLVETTGKFNIQPLDLRVSQDKIIVAGLLDRLIGRRRT